MAARDSQASRLGAAGSFSIACCIAAPESGAHAPVLGIYAEKPRAVRFA